jgi:hypothetical protein
VRDIARQLSVSKGSVSLWVRDIVLTAEQVARLLENDRLKSTFAARCRGGHTNRAKAEEEHQRFRQAGYEKARLDEQFRLLCALYWGEGSKSRTSGFLLANADPKMLRFVLKWLIDAGYDEAIGFRVQYYGENGLSEEEIREWWLAQLPRLKRSHMRGFTLCTINRASQRKNVGKLPYGTATVRVDRVELLYNMFGGIDYLIEMGA